MNGVLNIYKEASFTSHDVVAKLRGILKQKKIGHTGTLDPDAEGVLPVCLGNATKLCGLLSDKEKTYEFLKYPAVLYVDRLKDNEGYTLKEIWVLKDGRSSSSTNREDWTIYGESVLESVTFTNNSENVGDNTILIDDQTVIRLVYDQVDEKYTNGASFFDYEIATTKGTDEDWDTPHYGINDEGQYTGGGDAHYAFGNVNAGVEYGWDVWKGNDLNAYNERNRENGYAGCTFGLVTGIADDGDVQFADGISAPEDLFTTDVRTGKRVGTANLTFNQVGDTYTLFSVSGKMDGPGVGDEISASNLDVFNNPAEKYGHIWTNNFWPLDKTYINMPNFGDRVEDPKFYGHTDTGPANNQPFPWTDDFKDHNQYFGMRFQVGFHVTEDYVGPLDYYFFGDDDMWVFLVDDAGNSQLVCDIGGVHSSVGQYVNLWDYIDGGRENHENKAYSLVFFYTERGASGSTCYMRFTLPSVFDFPVTQDSGSLMISKKVESSLEDIDTQEFTFKLTLKDGSNNIYPAYIRYDENNNIIESRTIGQDGEFILRDGEHIEIQYLPVGTTFTIEEVDCPGYSTSYSVDGGEWVARDTYSGIIKNRETVTVAYVNSTGPRLPSTGGMGTTPFVTLGSLFTIGGGLLLIRRRWRGSHAAR